MEVVDIEDDDAAGDRRHKAVMSNIYTANGRQMTLCLFEEEEKQEVIKVRLLFNTIIISISIIITNVFLHCYLPVSSIHPCASYVQVQASESWHGPSRARVWHTHTPSDKRRHYLSFIDLLQKSSQAEIEQLVVIAEKVEGKEEIELSISQALVRAVMMLIMIMMMMMMMITMMIVDDEYLLYIYRQMAPSTGYTKSPCL